MDEKLKAAEALLESKVVLAVTLDISSLNFFFASHNNRYSSATYYLYVWQNLEIKKINEEKRAALAAQFAAEATLRRVHAAQKDDEMPPIEAIIAPLEAELKLARMEVHFDGYVMHWIGF